MVTVFGGTGFLGGAIVRHLVLFGHSVRIAARRPVKPDLGESNTDIELHAVDIGDAHAVSNAVRDASGVVNAVALYVEREGATFEAVHVAGAARVARCTRNAGGRLIHISGIGADPASPSRYVAARGRGEAAVLSEHPEAIILRPGVLFGRGDALLNNLEMVTRLPIVPLFGHGSTRLQPVHIDDVAAAVSLLLTSTFPNGKLYELGGGGIYTYREILVKVLNQLGRRRLLVPVPFIAWKLIAGLTSILPGSPLTIDQVILMETDNIVGNDVKTFSDLGIEPRALGEALEV